MARTSKDSRTYWLEREIEHAKSMLKDDQAVAKRIQALYEEAAREIEKEILALLVKYAEREGMTLAEARAAASKADIRDYEQKAAKYVREKDFSDTANKEMAIYNLKMRISRLELIQMHINLELVALTDGTERLLWDRLVNTGMKEAQRQAGILGDEVQAKQSEIEYIARRQFHGEDFSDRLWKNKRLLHDELEKRVAESIQKGQNPREAARKLREHISSSVYAAERLLITETARVQSEAQKLSFQKAGIEQYEYIVTEGACKICGPLSGQRFEVRNGMPGMNMPPMHPNCKCSTAAYMSRAELDRILEEAEARG